MSRPLVSIVVPCYNAEDFVEETLQSLLAQTYSPLEIIVIDDGSKDGSKKVLEKFSQEMKIISRENRGQSATLNEGWGQARGDVLGYLSADDLLLPNAIDEMMKIFEAQPEVSVLYPDYHLIDAKSRRLQEVKTLDFQVEDLVVNMICQPGPGALFRSEVFHQTRGWNSQLRQTPDYDFWLRASKLFNFMRVPLGLAEFRVHEESQSFAAPSPEKAQEPVTLMQSFIDSGFHPLLKGQQNAAASRSHILSARLHLRAQRFPSAWRHFLQAVRLDLRLACSWSSAKLLLHGALDPLRHRLRQLIR